MAERTAPPPSCYVAQSGGRRSERCLLDVAPYFPYTSLLLFLVVRVEGGGGSKAWKAAAAEDGGSAAAAAAWDEIGEGEKEDAWIGLSVVPSHPEVPTYITLVRSRAASTQEAFALF